MERIYWTYKDFKLKNTKLLKKTTTIPLNNGHKIHKPIFYYDSICTFDIETTTIKDADRPYAFMYIWQFCFDNDRVYMGRTWEDFRAFIKALKKELRLAPNKRLVVYIHNASYEFMFIKDFLEVYEVFQIGQHKFVKFMAEGIEFRCSYILTNMSLAKLCKNTPTCTHNKLSGEDYNYSAIRTPKSSLTDKELEYCYNDVKGLAECIEYRLNEYTLTTIPLTATGYVRREMRTAMSKNKNNKIIFNETKLTPFLYRLNRLAFRGGDTHSNPKYTGYTLPWPVKVMDIKSSYPASLIEFTYPMAPFERYEPKEYMSHYSEYYKEKCAIINVIYKDIKYTAPDNMPYIPASKCFELTGCIYDNGRVRQADALQTAVTDIDYNIIESSYTYSSKTVISVYAADRGFLPDEFRETVMEFFRIKSKLDGNPDMKYEYSKAKANLNSTYGMCVTKLDRPVMTWQNGEMVEITTSLNKMLDDYYDNPSNFLPYQWGVWCTAWSRLRLRSALQMVGADAVYCDTDSVFYVGDHEAEFEALNEKLKKLAIKHGATALDSNGNMLYLGVFEPDKSFQANGFKTLGAKKYIGRLDNGSMYCTIAGVSKSTGAAYFDKAGFEAFENGRVIPNSGHLVAYYNDEPKHYITVAGDRFITASNIALIDQDYTIGITNDYKTLLLEQAKNIIHLFS